MADQDPSKSARADLAKVPGLLDQYRQQRAAWLAQADELVRMREEVRQAAEREALEIVTAARSDVRRIIVEARRNLLVLTAQLHAAVEATDAPGLQMPGFAALLNDPERDRVDSAAGPQDITRDVVLEARKGVRSVLDEARAEIEALSAEAPAAVAAISSGAATLPGDWHSELPEPAGDAPSAAADAPPAADDDEKTGPTPVHELSLDSALSALDFQTRDRPIPTLAHILGTEPEAPASDEAPSSARNRFEPLSFETPRLAELRSLLRDASPPAEPVDTNDRPVLSPDVEPSASAPLAFDTTPRSNFFAGLEARPGELPESPASGAGDSTPAADAPRFTPPRLFGDQSDSNGPSKTARKFVGLFAGAGALAVAGTLWWAFTRETPELSAAAPSTLESPSTPAAATPAIAPSAPGTMALTIEARRPSWIRAEIDGKNEEGRVYQAGETRHIEGAHAVSIRAADAGAVFVGVDGAAARALGPNGQAATKEFSASTPPAAPAAVAPRPNNPVAPVVASVRAASSETLPARRPDVRPPQPAAAPPITPPASTAPAPAPPEGVSAARPDLVQAGQYWLDAYQRRDREAMATTGTENITISDERSVTERFPAWQSNVRRDLDQVELELTGDTALLTARMTEQAEGGQGGEHVSRVSQIWLRRNGRWRLADVRIIGEGRLNQIIR